MLRKILIINCSFSNNFSKNGAVVGTAPKDMKGPLFPTVAVHSQNEEYVVPLSKCLAVYALYWDVLVVDSGARFKYCRYSGVIWIDMFFCLDTIFAC